MTSTISINCPQCGASPGIEYRTNHFICPHCDSKYRWTDPNRKVVQIQQSVCFCGNNSVGCCTDCGASVCDTHHTDLHDLLRAWQFIRRICAELDPRIPKYAEQASSKPIRWKRAKPGWFFDHGGLADVYRIRSHQIFVSGPFEEVFLIPLLEQVGWEHRYLPGLLCLNCTEECCTTLGPFFDARAGWFAKHGRFCDSCVLARNHDDPEFCRNAIPEIMTDSCSDCGQRLCRKHQRACPYCQASLCLQGHADYCPNCRWKPWRWF